MSNKIRGRHIHGAGCINTYPNCDYLDDDAPSAAAIVRQLVEALDLRLTSPHDSAICGSCREAEAATSAALTAARRWQQEQEARS